MTAFFLVYAVFALLATFFMLMTWRAQVRLDRRLTAIADRAQADLYRELEAAPVKGTAKFTHQTRFGLIDIDLHR